MLQAVAEHHREIAVVAAREAERRSELEQLVATTVTLPTLPTDVHDLAAPYYLMDISLDAKLLPCTVLTMGGLVVDEATGAVLREDGSAIAGLYAAGRTAVGVPSHLYMSGLSVADGVFSGRRAARAVLASGVR